MDKKEKPPVLSDEEIREVEKKWFDEMMEGDEPEIRIAEAQRDADIEWFKQAGYVRLAKDQSLPENPHKRSLDEEGIPEDKLSQEIMASNIEIHNDAQQTMLKAYFRKIEQEDL